MKLSVIIVSYNVRDFLEACLHSVENATSGIESEIIVIDNNSPDNSAEMVKQKFPSVRLIHNNENLGFSKANNQARQLAGGEYVLFLNPDTLVEKDTFRVCVEFMDSHPGTGAMGVKMTDGRGRFLPESKRAVPTPLVAFYKISGLTALFPRSKVFGRYYLGHLDREKPHYIEVLTGAFLFARKKALDEVDWFDESFFMYGEDIDLSCRLLQKGYTIYYHPGTRIIHYKGVSTRKSSINYVLVFYRAMAIYARKHFRSPGTNLLIYLLFIAIYSRASLAIIKRILNRIVLPVTDTAIICSGFFLVPSTWDQILSSGGRGYPSENPAILIPAITLIWLVFMYFAGAYKTPFRPVKAARGIFLGAFAILIVYGMLSDQWYLKLLTILPMALWAVVGTTTIRYIAIRISKKHNRHRYPQTG